MIKYTAYFLLPLAILASTDIVSAASVSVVPPGNRNAVQPPVPGASARRTRALATSYSAKYRKIYTLLQQDNRLNRQISQTAAAYGIAPIHIAGAIAGEHTYNVDAYDRLQAYYIKGIAWASEDITFAYRGETVLTFARRPQFAACQAFTDSYRLWSCREEVWEKQFRGKTVNGRRWPDNRFSAVFFQPFFAGQTFGLGQVNPLTALKVSDLVNQTSGLPKLDANNGAQLYRTIMDPNLTIPYIAATIRQSIDAYKQIADFDISQNPGITATLYNLGGAEQRARALAAENKKRKAQGKAPRLPQENYYGWFVNTQQKELEKLFPTRSGQAEKHKKSLHPN